MYIYIYVKFIGIIYLCIFLPVLSMRVQRPRLYSESLKLVIIHTRVNAHALDNKITGHNKISHFVF